MTRKILRIVAPFIFIAACQKHLDQQPLSDLSTDLFWKSPDDARLGIAGMYDGLQKTLSSNYIDWCEPRSDDFKAGGNGEAQVNLSLNALDANQAEASWDNLYVTISRANFAIKYIPRISGLAGQLRDHFLAQAYAMRGYCYFYAVRVWGGVPLWLTPYEDLTKNVALPRTPAEEVLNTVVADLKKADSLVDTTVTSPVFEINAGGILAMLTEVYMWKKEYQNALDASGRLLAFNRYSLAAAADWKKLFIDPAGTKENIWSLNWVYTQDGANGMAIRYGCSDLTSYYYIEPDLVTRFRSNPGDIRRRLTYDTALETSAVGKIGKFYPLGTNGKPAYPSSKLSDVNYPLYRLADILLLRAEAYNKLGGAANTTAAVDLLNQIRTRAGIMPVTEDMFPTQDDLELAILNERQLELFGEGKRWFDLIRTDRAIPTMDTVLKARQQERGFAETGFGDPGRILFPISRTALNENKNLVQNPPYSD